MALYTTLAEAKARLIPGRIKNPTIAGDKINRRWEKIDATQSQDLMASVPSTVVNPQADGETYTGTYAVGQQLAQAQGDRAVTITQELTLINTITSTIGTLQALSPLKEYNNEILRAFSLEEGEGDRIAWTYKNINPENRSIAMAYSDSDIESTVGANAGEYLSRRFIIQEDGTATFVIITEGHTWSAWGHDSYAADKTEYDNAGTANERERITKTWEGIRISDIATAVSNMRTGTNTAAESGYIITTASTRDNQDGSLTCVQVQKKQVDDQFVGNPNDDRTNPTKDAINPHGWDGGRIDYIEVVFDHFTQAGLNTAIGSLTPPGGSYIQTNIGETLAGDGLYNRVYRYELPVWSNSTNGGQATATVTNWRENYYSNTEPDGQGVTQYGIRASITESGTGVPIADLANARDNVTATNGYALTDVTARDDKNGSGTIRKAQTKKRGKTDEFRTTWVAGSGSQQEAEIVTWHDLSDTDADLVIADAKANTADMTGATYAASPASHVLKTVGKKPVRGVDSSGDQLFDVSRVTYIPRNSSGGWWGTLANGYIYIAYQRKRDLKYIGIEQLRTDSKANAQDFVDVDTSGSLSAYTKAAAAALFDAAEGGTGADWATAAGDGSMKLIGYDAGWKTGVFRQGQDMWLAYRVWAYQTPIT